METRQSVAWETSAGSPAEGQAAARSQAVVAPLEGRVEPDVLGLW